MAKTLVNFVQPPQSPFQFQATLDGTTYTVIVPYNVFGERYYVSIYTLQGQLVLNLPLIGSPTDADISITAGYFTTPLIWREPNNQFEIG